MHRSIGGYSSAARDHDKFYGVEHSERSLKSLNCSQAIFTATIRPAPARFLLLIWVLDTLSIPSRRSANLVGRLDTVAGVVLELVGYNSLRSAVYFSHERRIRRHVG